MAATKVSGARRLALLVTGLLAVAATPCHAQTDLELAEAFEQGMRSAPGTAELFDAFEQEFPAEYATLVGRGVELVKQSATMEQVEALIMPIITDVLSKATQEVARAPNRELFDYLERRTEAIRALALRSQANCAFLALGSTSALLPEREAAAEVAPFMVRMNTALLLAAGAARRDPHLRPMPSQDDFLALGEKMFASSLEEKDLELAADETTLRQAPAETQCRVGIAMYDALAAVPEDLRERLAVAVLAP